LSDCNNLIYLKNLIESLEEAKKQKDIERIVIFASELERYKIVCGNSPVIQQFEASMRRVSEELEIQNHPAIERALSANPEHLCQCHTCEQSPPTQHQEGFRGMLEAAAGTIETIEEEQPNIKRGFADVGFRAMLDAAAHGTSSEKKEDAYREAPIVRGYGMGFRAMLDAATNPIKQEDEEPKTVLRGYGFVGMLEDAYRGTPEPRIIMRMAHR